MPDSHDVQDEYDDENGNANPAQDDAWQVRPYYEKDEPERRHYGRYHSLWYGQEQPLKPVRWSLFTLRHGVIVSFLLSQRTRPLEVEEILINREVNVIIVLIITIIRASVLPRQTSLCVAGTIS